MKVRCVRIEAIPGKDGYMFYFSAEGVDNLFSFYCEKPGMYECGAYYELQMPK